MEEKKAVRLNKYLAECGICSRREADRLIESGKVTVDGRPAVMGDKVNSTTQITVNGKKAAGKDKKIVLAFYKPAGVTCTNKDAHAKVTVTDYLKYPIRVSYAGRLDKDSEGLLIMTNDGELAQQMMRAANHHEKEYVVKVNKKIEEDFLKEMEKGVYLKELDTMTRFCKTEKIGDYTFRIVLTQGLNRQIRRMCMTLGYQVTKLKRIRVVNITLGNLKIGEYREIAGAELEKLYQEVGGSR